MELITMTDYVIHLSKNGYKEFDETRQDLKGLVYSDALKIWITNKLVEYAKLLKTKIEVEMFLPCDDNGKVLKDPELTMCQGDGTVYYRADDEEFELYSKAEDKVIFRNVETRPLSAHGSFTLEANGHQIGYYKAKPKYWVDMDRNIETLCGLGIKLKKGWEKISSGVM